MDPCAGQNDQPVATGALQDIADGGQNGREDGAGPAAEGAERADDGLGIGKRGVDGVELGDVAG